MTRKACQDLLENVIRSIVWIDDDTFMTSGFDGFVRTWHVSSGTLIHSFCALGGPIWHMALHPRGNTEIQLVILM